jgi:hypothetical protein
MIEFKFGEEVRHLRDKDGRQVDLVGRTKHEHCKFCARFYVDKFSNDILRCELYPKKFWYATWEACKFFLKKT